MQNRSVLACAIVSLLACASCDKLKSAAGDGAGSLFGGDFEGEITMNATTRGQANRGGPNTLVFGVKKPKYRIDATGGTASDNPMLAQGASFLLDPPQKKGWILNPAMKQAIVLDFEKMKREGGPPGMPGKPRPAGVKEPPPKVEKTGKKEVVAGYTCEIWKITQNDGRKADVCAAEGITWIDLGDMGWSSPEITIAAVASEANRFPLRIVAYDKAGAEETRLEATKVEKKKLDDAKFIVPPDYKVIDMAQMMNGLMQGIPGAPPGVPGGGLPPGFPKGLPTNIPVPPK